MSSELHEVLHKDILTTVQNSQQDMSTCANNASNQRYETLLRDGLANLPPQVACYHS